MSEGMEYACAISECMGTSLGQTIDSQFISPKSANAFMRSGIANLEVKRVNGTQQLQTPTNAALTMHTIQAVSAHLDLLVMVEISKNAAHLRSIAVRRMTAENASVNTRQRHVVKQWEATQKTL